MNTARPITEDDLHAYVDHMLDPGRRAEVEHYLADHPDAARLAERFAEQRAMLQAAFGSIAEETVPPQLSLPVLTGARDASRRHVWRSAAAAVLLLVAGGSAGWLGRGVTLRPNTGIAAVAQEALTSFDVYGSDQVRPVEVSATNRGDLLKWLSNRLGRAVVAPDLTASGYRLMGGRLVATQHGPAGLFMYDNAAGERLAMLVRPMANEKNGPMSEHVEGAVSGFAWAQDGLGYGLVGATPPGVLHPLANEVRRQVGGRT